MADTTYIVLERQQSGQWGELGVLDAKSATGALRKMLADAAPPQGAYVAVPARSWKPVTVEAVQTTVLKLS